MGLHDKLAEEIGGPSVYVFQVTLAAPELQKHSWPATFFNLCGLKCGNWGKWIQKKEWLKSMELYLRGSQ